MTKIITCLYCGNEFSSHNKNPKFCSRKCRGLKERVKVDIEMVRFLYGEMKMTREEISIELGVSQKVIENTMKKNGIKTRVAAKRNQTGEQNDNWKGGKVIHSGYVLKRVPKHPRASKNGYFYEHVLIMEQHLGRFLKWYGRGNRLNEVVHHKNEIKTDNRIENLELMTASEHIKLHNRLRSERRNERNKNSS